MANTIAVTAPTGPYSWAQATGIAAAAQGEITGIDWTDRIVVVISGLTSETVSVTGRLNGTTVYTSSIEPIDLKTGVPSTASSALLGNGSFLFKDWALDSIKFTKSSTSETPVITVALKGIRN